MSDAGTPPPPAPPPPPPAAPPPSGAPGTPPAAPAGPESQPTEQLVQDEKLWGLLSCVLGLVGAILGLVLQPKSKFVKFWALQSIFLWVGLMVVFTGLGIVMMVMMTAVPFLGMLGMCFGPLAFLASLALAIFLGLKAYNGLIFKLPVIGDIAYKSAYGS
jgi:uncharacterized membrane protein